MPDKPAVTVAAIAQQDGRFLLVEERADDAVVINQPAGHLEAGETLLEAVVRETLEETRFHFVPEALVGVYQWATDDGRVYVRLAFSGHLAGESAERTLDEGILRPLWLSRDELAQRDNRRSPLVLRCVDDYLDGQRYPLTVINEIGDE
ncbi:NUDIX hydrolase [Ectothiorhodospiraceae bacterium 2226]|nr:NUDIX hydrolase [Ectothiorhodospiraceae bacterium 2226]